jgi:alkylhydroperoxidase family enzyme
MTWIRSVSEDEATGRLAESYRQARARAGRVYAIVRAMSLAPEVLDASIGLYLSIMFARGPLSRRQREMLAVVVSGTNGCHY